MRSQSLLLFPIDRLFSALSRTLFPPWLWALSLSTTNSYLGYSACLKAARGGWQDKSVPLASWEITFSVTAVLTFSSGVKARAHSLLLAAMPGLYNHTLD